MSRFFSRLAILAVTLLAMHCGRDETGDECSIFRFASALPGRAPYCVDIAVSTLPDGTSACRAFAASARPECDCQLPGRKPPRQAECRLELTVSAASEKYACVCELTQLGGTALSACLSDDQDRTDGWCYAASAPERGPSASAEVTAACSSGQRFKLQGGAALAEDETLLLTCDSLASE